MAERKFIPVEVPGMLEIGNQVNIKRILDQDAGMTTTVTAVRRKGREVELSLRSGSKAVVISIRKGGVWQEKGEKSGRCSYVVSLLA